jgi:hypothetical protein
MVSATWSSEFDGSFGFGDIGLVLPNGRDVGSGIRIRWFKFRRP